MKFPTLLERLITLKSTWIINDNVPPANLFSSWNYAVSDLITFYSQPLALWMFVPCGEDGKPLSKPVEYEIWLNKGLRQATKIYGHLSRDISPRCSAYQAAEQRVLFEGWVLTQNTGIKRLRKDRYTIRLSDKTGQCTVEGAQRFIAKEIFSLDGFINTVPFLTPPNQQRSN